MHLSQAVLFNFLSTSSLPQTASGHWLRLYLGVAPSEAPSGEIFGGEGCDRSGSGDEGVDESLPLSISTIASSDSDGERATNKESMLNSLLEIATPVGNASSSFVVIRMISGTRQLQILSGLDGNPNTVG